MKSFIEGPLSLLLAVFATFGMLRSLLALIEAVSDEPARTATAAMYLVLLVCIFAGGYMVFLPRPAKAEESDTPAADEQVDRISELEKIYNMRLAGVFLLTLSLALTLNSWLMPYLALTPSVPTPTVTPGITPSVTSTLYHSNTPSATASAPTLTSTPSPTPSRTPTPTLAPAGTRMQVILPRVHVREEPTSKSASISELNNGDWLFFDGRALDEEGTLWLRIGTVQPDSRFTELKGFWVFSGGLELVGVGDLPLLPATATPAG